MRHVTPGAARIRPACDIRVSRMSAMALLHRVALLSLVLFITGACGALERWACGEPCEGGVEPAEGSQADVTRAGQDDELATVSEPTFCEDIGGEAAHVVQVVTHGSDTEVSEGEWITDRLRPQLIARDVSTGWGLGPCTDPADPERQGLRVFTSDWADVDPIVETILELAAEDDAALALTIAVEPIVIACPQDDCGA